jgi:hypothetical protein
MLSDFLRQLDGDPYFFPLAAILAVIVIARLAGEHRMS